MFGIFKRKERPNPNTLIRARMAWCAAYDRLPKFNAEEKAVYDLIDSSVGHDLSIAEQDRQNLEAAEGFEELVRRHDQRVNEVRELARDRLNEWKAETAQARKDQ